MEGQSVVRHNKFPKRADITEEIYLMEGMEWMWRWSYKWPESHINLIFFVARVCRHSKNDVSKTLPNEGLRATLFCRQPFLFEIFHWFILIFLTPILQKDQYFLANALEYWFGPFGFDWISKISAITYVNGMKTFQISFIHFRL